MCCLLLPCPIETAEFHDVFDWIEAQRRAVEAEAAAHIEPDTEDDEHVTTVQFALDGVDYEIDLTRAGALVPARR